MVLLQNTTDSVMKWQNPIIFLMQTVVQSEWGWRGLQWNQIANIFAHALDQFSTDENSRKEQSRRRQRLQSIVTSMFSLYWLVHETSRLWKHWSCFLSNYYLLSSLLLTFCVAHCLCLWCNNSLSRWNWC